MFTILPGLSSTCAGEKGVRKKANLFQSLIEPRKKLPNIETFYRQHAEDHDHSAADRTAAANGRGSGRHDDLYDLYLSFHKLFSATVQPFAMPLSSGLRAGPDIWRFNSGEWRDRQVI